LSARVIIRCEIDSFARDSAVVREITRITSVANGQSSAFRYSGTTFAVARVAQQHVPNILGLARCPRKLSKP